MSHEPSITDAGAWVVVAADVPLAPATHGNRVRNVQLVAALRAAGLRVSYLYWERSAREDDVDAMRALVDELTVVRAPRGAFARRRTRLQRRLAGGLRSAGLIGERAWWRLVEDDERAACPPALVAALEGTLERLGTRCAGVIASYANLWPLARAARARGKVAVIDTHDLMHARAATLFAQRVRPTGLLVRRDVEARWLREADVVVAIQEREAEALRELVGAAADGARVATRVLTIGHGVAPVLTPGAELDPRAERAVTILGSNNRPNQHGLEWFVRDVWPLVLSQVSDAELRVFGPLSRTDACRGPRVRACGEVDDPGTAQESALVAVNPVLAGSGLKIKTVDALAWGRALVTTSRGAEGLEDGAGEAFALADDPAAFAAACVHWLADPARAREQGRRARAWALARFAPERVYAPLVAILQRGAFAAQR